MAVSRLAPRFFFFFSFLGALFVIFKTRKGDLDDGCVLLPQRYLFLKKEKNHQRRYIEEHSRVRLPFQSGSTCISILEMIFLYNDVYANDV